MGPEEAVRASAEELEEALAQDPVDEEAVERVRDRLALLATRMEQR